MNLGLRRWSIAVAGGALGLLGCNVTPEGGNSMNSTEHCGDLQGDFTCQSIYSGRPFCSLCAEELQGCVSTPPALICQPASDTGMQTDTGEESTGGSSDGGSTTLGVDSTGADGSTGEPPCEAEGELDPGCMELDPLRPFCVDASCVSCEGAGGDAFCGDLDLTTPACNPTSGSCVSCEAVERPVCADATPVCGSEGACQACVSHDECPGSACHLGADDPLLGSCFSPDEVLWVDNSAACPGLGTAEDPLCLLTSTVDMISAGESRVVRIMGGGMPYAERVNYSGPLTIAIIGDGQPVISGTPGFVTPTLAIEDETTAYIDGISLSGNGLTHGLMCNDSTVIADDLVVMDNSGWGIFDYQPCTLDLQRAVVVGNEDGGVRLNGGSLSLINSTVGLNGVGGNSTGVRVTAGEVEILYSTIAGNDGSGSDSVECLGATGSIRNSIIMGVDTPSIELDCFPLVMANNAMDAVNFAGGSNEAIETYTPIYFNGPAEGDFTLSAPPLTPFIDVAQWQEGDPELDADGTPRPMGQLGYAGVDEP